jgi:hypothetical protein
MSLADAWHDPRGPEPLVEPDVKADEVIRGFVTDELNKRFREAAQAAGLDDEWIEGIILAASQG